MKTNSGEIVIGLLIGIFVGAATLYVKSGQEAQERANQMGVSVSQWDVVAEQPGKSTLTVIAPAAAGAGIGWLLEEVSGGSDNGGGNVNINASTSEGNVTVSVIGNQDNDTSSNTSTRNDNQGSYNQ
jgi:gas vesicle protein